MILIEPVDYYKVVDIVKEVSVNNLFARWIVEGYMRGQVFVDHVDHPKTCYVSHPYGLSLLCGDEDQEWFNRQLIDYVLNRDKQRTKDEWLQMYPLAWNERFTEMVGDHLVPSGTVVSEVPKIEVNTRVNFKFNKEVYLNLKRTLTTDQQVLEVDRKMFSRINGTVVPKAFWSDSKHFSDQGVGFSLMHEGKIASTAFSAFVMDGALEIGIETQKKYQGKNFAVHVCSRLIDYCLEQALEPVWSCKKENIASYCLAQKLGFQPTVMLPFYRLLL